MRIGRGALIRGLIGIAISLVAIVILLRSVDVAEVVDILRGASPAWIAVMVLATLVDIGARGARWQALLAPIAAVPYRRVLGYTYIGYLANNILPARLGELVRSHALGEGEGISRTTVLGTVVVERIVDTVMVVSIAARQRPRAERPRRDDQRGPAGPRVRDAAGRRAGARHGRPSAARARTAWSRSSSAGRGSSSSAGACATACAWPAGRGPWPRRSSSARSPGAPRSRRSSPAARPSASS